MMFGKVTCVVLTALLSLTKQKKRWRAGFSAYPNGKKAYYCYALLMESGDVVDDESCLSKRRLFIYRGNVYSHLRRSS